MSLLTPRKQELVSLGAALGSNCISCIEHHIPASRKAWADRSGDLGRDWARGQGPAGTCPQNARHSFGASLCIDADSRGA